MSIVQDIQKQAKQLLSQHSMSEEELTAKLDSLVPTNYPQKVKMFGKNIINQCKQPELVWVNLMVQDIREQQYTYSFLVKRPLNSDSQIIVLKYGASYSEQLINKIESQQYLNIMTSGEQIICCSQKYRSSWTTKQEQLKNIKMLITNHHEFKLGQQIQALCVWNPNYECLQFIRKASKEEIQQYGLSYNSQFNQIETQFKKLKNQIILELEKIFPTNYAHILFFTILSDKPYFIDGPNISNILEDILPRVCQLRVQFPIKTSLFPYKNEQGELVDTHMQMSSAKTFTILDFSHLKCQNQVKIYGDQIDNLKALKVFVEEGMSVYRWEYGQSLFPHKNSGIIVKASSILCPHFKSGFNFDASKEFENPFSSLNENQKLQIRAYFERCNEFDPKIEEGQRESIYSLMEQQIQKNKQLKIDFENLMFFAKMNAKSEGRNSINPEDYLVGRNIIFQKV